MYSDRWKRIQRVNRALIPPIRHLFLYSAQQFVLIVRYAARGYRKAWTDPSEKPPVPPDGRRYDEDHICNECGGYGTIVYCKDKYNHRNGCGCPLEPCQVCSTKEPRADEDLIKWP